MLDEIAGQIPSDFFRELNGGIILLEKDKKHPESTENYPLYIMGEYQRSIIGRQIILYYGSFCKAYSHLSERRIYGKLKDTLLHEFTHHLEHMAGERGLEKKDASQMQAYRRIR